MDQEYEEITRKMRESLKISDESKDEVHIPVKDMDDVTDISKDEPWTPIPGTTKMTRGKQAARQDDQAKLSMDESCIKWARQHVTLSSAWGMRKLRLYVMPSKQSA